MHIRHEYKGGYSTDGASLFYRLTILSRDIDSQSVFGFAEAVDRQYRRLIDEQFGTGGKEVFSQWQDSPLN